MDEVVIAKASFLCFHIHKGQRLLIEKPGKAVFGYRIKASELLFLLLPLSCIRRLPVFHDFKS